MATAYKGVIDGWSHIDTASCNALALFGVTRREPVLSFLLGLESPYPMNGKDAGVTLVVLQHVSTIPRLVSEALDQLVIARIGAVSYEGGVALPLTIDWKADEGGRQENLNHGSPIKRE